MGNGDAKPDSRAHRFFSLPKRLQDRIAIRSLNMSFLNQKID